MNEKVDVTVIPAPSLLDPQMCFNGKSEAAKA